MALENGILKSVCEPTRWREANAAIEHALERGKLCQLVNQRLIENQESRKKNPTVDLSQQHEADVDAVIIAARAWHDATTKVLLAAHSAAHIPYDSIKAAFPLTVYEPTSFKISTESSSSAGQKDAELASAAKTIERAESPRAPPSQPIKAAGADVDSENDSVPITLTSDSDQAMDFDCSGSDSSSGGADDNGEAQQRPTAFDPKPEPAKAPDAPQASPMVVPSCSQLEAPSPADSDAATEAVNAGASSMEVCSDERGAYSSKADAAPSDSTTNAPGGTPEPVPATAASNDEPLKSIPGGESTACGEENPEEGEEGKEGEGAEGTAASPRATGGAAAEGEAAELSTSPSAVRDRMYRMLSVTSMPSPSRFRWAELAEEEEEMGMLSPLPPLPANYYGDDGDDEGEDREEEGGRAESSCQGVVSSSSSSRYEYRSYSTSDHYNVSYSGQYHYVSTHDEQVGPDGRRSGQSSEDTAIWGAGEPGPGSLRRRDRDHGRKGPGSLVASRTATMSAPSISSVLQVACDAAAAAERICRAMRESGAMRPGPVGGSSSSVASAGGAAAGTPMVAQVSGMSRSASTSKVTGLQGGGSGGRKKGSGKDARASGKALAPAGEGRSGSATNLAAMAGVPAAGLRGSGKNRSDAALSWRRETPLEAAGGGTEGVNPRMAGMVAREGSHMSRSASASQVCPPSQRQGSSVDGGDASASSAQGGASASRSRRARRSSLNQQGGKGVKEGSGTWGANEHTGGLQNVRAGNSTSGRTSGGSEVSSHTGEFRGMSFVSCPIMVLADHGEDQEEEEEEEEAVSEGEEEEVEEVKGMGKRGGKRGGKGEGKRAGRQGQDSQDGDSSRDSKEGGVGNRARANAGSSGADASSEAAGEDDDGGFITVTRDNRRSAKAGGGNKGAGGSNNNNKPGSHGRSNNSSNTNSGTAASSKRATGEGSGRSGSLSKMSASAAIFVPGLAAAANATTAPLRSGSATDLSRPSGYAEVAPAGSLEQGASSNGAHSPAPGSSPGSGSGSSWADAVASFGSGSSTGSGHAGGDAKSCCFVSPLSASPVREGGASDGSNEGGSDGDGWEQVSHGRKKGSAGGIAVAAAAAPKK